MITIIIVLILLPIVIIIFKKQIDDLVDHYLIAKILKYISIILLGLFIILSAIMGIGEMFSGDFSGIVHLVTIIPLSIIVYLLIKSP